MKDPGRVLELFTVDHLKVTRTANLARTPVSHKNLLDFRAENNGFAGPGCCSF